MKNIALMLTGAAILVTVFVAISREETKEPAADPAGRYTLPEWLRVPEERLAAVAAGTSCPASSGTGDLDGDGRLDAVIVASSPPCQEYTDSRVAVVLADGFVSSQPLPAGATSKTGRPCSVGCAVFSIADLDSDGRAEVAIELGHGASQVQLGLYRWRGRRLARIRVPDAYDDSLFYYGSLCCGSHVSCRGRNLVVDSSYGYDGVWGQMQISERILRLDEKGLTLVARRAYDRAGFQPAVAGRNCLDPEPLRNAEAELDQLTHSDR